MNWSRILVFALVLFALAKAVAYLLGMLYPYTWQLYGATLEQAAPLILPARRIVTAVLSLGVYLVFLRAIRVRPLAQVLVLCVMATVLTVAWDAWGARSVHEAFDPRSFIGHVVVALAAWLASMLFRRFGPEQILIPHDGSSRLPGTILVRHGRLGGLLGRSVSRHRELLGRSRRLVEQPLNTPAGKAPALRNGPAA